MAEEENCSSGTVSGQSTADINDAAAADADDDNDDDDRADDREFDVSVDVVELRQHVEDHEKPKSLFRREVQAQYNYGWPARWTLVMAACCFANKLIDCLID